ncbi:MAG: type II toxin-antitoxin system death-on-curing family toxin [Opitutaceae bacterium]|nr:type II toxin-antitoxin system death-on-curing family toxin [Opitutaceae bacterium]
MNRADGCLHLTVEIVEEIHTAAITRFGGSLGLRDRSMLESAVAAPQASFAGASPFSDVIDVAAAYLFYLSSNHPFVDGNKRAALGACLIFLQLNELTPAKDGPEWEAITLDVASGALRRDEVTERLRSLVSGA